MSVVVPAFKAEQNESHILLHVAVPDCPPDCTHRAVVDEGIFGVSCPHAHLPLVFEKDQVVNAQGQFSPSSDAKDQSILLKRLGDVLTVSLPKAQHAQHVHGLDSIKASLFPIVPSGDSAKDEEERLAGLGLLQKGVDAVANDRDGQQDDDDDVLTSNLQAALPATPKVSHNVKTRMHELFAEQLPASHLGRIKHAMHKEDDKWDEGMYLDSFVDQDGEIEHLVQAQLPPLKDVDAPATKRRAKAPDLSNACKRDMHLLLLELLLAHAYDRRSTSGEPTVESGWTIATQCRSLVGSCLPSSADKDDCKSVLQASVRRQLCYTLYRHWQLSSKVVEDVVQLLGCKADVRTSIRQVQQLFDHGDDEALPTYNSAVIEPLLHYFDVLFDNKSLLDLSVDLREAVDALTKEDVGPEWDIMALEEAAKESIERGEGGFV
jgi:protein SHQ1